MSFHDETLFQKCASLFVKHNFLVKDLENRLSQVEKFDFSQLSQLSQPDQTFPNQIFNDQLFPDINSDYSVLENTHLGNELSYNYFGSLEYSLDDENEAIQVSKKRIELSDQDLQDQILLKLNDVHFLELLKRVDQIITDKLNSQ